jgi:Ca2+-binding RTX toxin-like protein
MKDCRSPGNLPPLLFRPNGSKEPSDVDRQSPNQNESPRCCRRFKNGLALILILLLVAVIIGISGDSHDSNADWSKRSDPGMAADSKLNQQASQDGLRRATRDGFIPELLFRLGNLWGTASGNTADSETERLPNGNRNVSNGMPGQSSDSLPPGGRDTGSPVVPLGIGGTATQAEINALSAGLEETFTAVEANLIARVFADTLPLVGDHLTAEPTPTAPARHYLTALKTAINSGLATLTGSPTYTEIQVETAINTALALTSAGITFNSVNLDASNATDLKLSMNTSKAFPAFATPIDSAIGLPGLGLQLLTTDPLAVSDAQVALSYTLNFGVGVDAQGFYLNTANNASLFTTGFSMTLPTLNVKATLSKLRFHLTDESAADGDGVPATLFNGSFAVDLLDPGGADTRRRTTDLGGVLLSATLTGNAAINLNLTSDLEAAALPEITTDLNIAWGFTNAVVDPAVGIASFGTVPTVAFKKVSLGLDSFFNSFVNSVFDGVQTLTDPVQPIVDLLNTEIGFLSELAGETVTLIDLASGSGAVDPDTAARLELAVSLLDLINSPRNGGTVRIDLGDYSIGTQDPRSTLFHLEDVVPLKTRNPAPPAAQNGDLAGFLSAKNGLPGGGMTFDLIEDPSAVIDLIFGKQVDFFTYHVPSLDVVGTGYDQFFSIFGPFGVRLTATIEAHAYLDIGYDSSGLARFAASGNEADIFDGFYVVDQTGPEAVFSASLRAAAAANIIIAELGVGGGITGSLLADLADNDLMPNDGRVHLGELTDSCIFELTGQISVGLFAYLEIGIGPFSETFEKDFGSLVLLSFDLSSCDSPGLPGVILAHNIGSNVALHVGLDASLRQVGSLEDGAEDFRVTHVSGALGSEVVAVNGTGLRNFDGAPAAPQNYTVGANGDITANGGEKDDRLTLAPDVLSPSNLRGGAGDDRLDGGYGNDTLNGDAGLDVLVGGDGSDLLNGGADQDFLDGQDGDDELLGGSQSDILLGGAGADVLNGGPGFDTATYVSAAVGVFLNLSIPGSGGSDAQGDSYISIERIVGSPHADILFGSPDSDNFSGGADSDVLDGKEGDDLLVGDAGADSITGGPGNDSSAYTLSPAAVSVSLLTGIGSGGDAAGDTLFEIENLHGSDFGDTLEGNNGPNWLRGLSGANTLRGNGGDDLLEGGKDNDLLEGGAANDTLRASLDVASLDPAVSGGIDTLLGGAGDDFLYGDAGGDTLDGGDDDDQVFGGKDGDTISGGNGNDQLYGAKGNDSLAGGFGNDLIDGGDNDDIITVGAIRGPVQDPDRLDRVSGGPGFDIVSADFSDQSQAMTIVAGQTNSLVFPNGAYAIQFENTQDFMTGSGNDSLFLAGAGGNAAGNLLRTGPGNDEIYSGAGADVVDAGDGDDIVEGGPGADNLDGGPGRNVLYYLASPQFVDVDLELSGTTGPVGSDSFGDTIANFQDLYGSAFDDFLRGTAGPNKIMGRAGNDFIDGRGGDNELYGEDGNDQIFSGVGNDTIFGGIGNDTINAGEGINNVLGEAGNDVITAGSGPDTLGGGANDDQISAGDGVNVIIGDAGNDILISGNGVDNIQGGTENDTASSGAGDDLVYGEDGNDSLDAGIGSDVVDGGIGNDFLSVGALRGPVQDPNRLDHLFGGAGFDTITADFSNQSVPMTVIAGLTQSLVFADGTEARDFENVHDLFTSSGTFDDVLRLDGASDDGFGNLLKTGGGNDVIYSGRGSDNVDAGDGDDYVNGGPNDAVLDNSGSFGTVIGFTGPGETLVGGVGNDTISFENVIKPSGVFSSFSPYYGVVVDLSTNTTDGSARGVTINGFENVTGTQYGDILTGDAGPNIFRPLHGGGYYNTFASGGPDRIDGKGGIDTVIIDFSGEDLSNSGGVTSSPGNLVSAASYSRTTPASPFSSQDNFIVAAVEKFQITGASKNDQITGGSINTDDILIGLGGNDTLGGYGGSDVLLGGDGNDVLSAQGATSSQFINVAGGHDTLDSGPGDDQIDDIAFNGATPMLGADALFQIDGGTGFDTLSVDFSNHPEAVVWTSAAPKNIEFPDGAYARNFERLNYLVSGPGNDSITQLGRVASNFDTGGGDDSVAPGLGNDTVKGGAGTNDMLILDYSVDDLPTYSGVNGSGDRNTFRRDGPGAVFPFDYVVFSGFERMRLVGTSRADTIYDLAGDDIISGGAGNDTINGRNSFAFGGGNDTFNGGDGNDVLMGGAGNDVLTGGFGLGPAGANEIDRLVGDEGADVFVLGDADKRFYDDQSSATPGIGAYASIEDFTPSQSDRLRLFGSASQYLLGTSPIAGTPGTALYHDSNGNAVLDTATDELIAILASPVTLSVANTLNTATFIQILDPAVIGLAAITPAVADDGTGPRFKVQFSIAEPMTAGMLLEIQASTDLGASDPWATVASKTGNASWVGPANVTVSAPSAGKVTIAVSALQPVSIVGRQFFRFRLSSL